MWENIDVVHLLLYTFLYMYHENMPIVIHYILCYATHSLDEVFTTILSFKWLRYLMEEHSVELQRM